MRDARRSHRADSCGDGELALDCPFAPNCPGNTTRVTVMDQTTKLSAYDRRQATDRLANAIVQSIEAARGLEKPFFHLEFDRVFPDDVYSQILALMPESADYRPMQGSSKGHDIKDGTNTRVTMDLFL